MAVTNSTKDQLYAAKQDKVDDFVFDENVATVFADMIQRSVPGYVALNQLLPTVANSFIRPGTNVYDLGCSLGEATLAIANAIQYDDVKIIAVDNSQAMIQQLEERITASDLKIFIKPICSDVVENNIENASFVVLNYTLQFIDWAQRDELIARVYSGLQEDGALLLAEKIIYEDAEEEALMQQLHENFKRDNDYSDLEISQKREALENVLVRDTHEQHIKRLYQAGFSKIFILAKYLNFISYVAVK